MNKHDELVLKLIAEEMLEEDDEIFMKEVEEAKNDPAFANTEISRKRIEKAIDEELKKLKKNKKRKSKMFVRVASILLVLLLGFSATTLTVKGFREKVWAFITNVGNSTHSSIIPSNDDYNSALDSYEGKYIPGWIPEGYKITDVINKTDIKTIKIQNTLGSSISFSEHTKNYDELLNIHKENLNDYQRMELNGVEVLINKQNSITNMIVIQKDAIIYILFNNSDIDIVGFVNHIETK